MTAPKVHSRTKRGGSNSNNGGTAAAAGNVRVVARIRPLAQYEHENGSKETVTSLNALVDDDCSSGGSGSGGPELVQALPGPNAEKRWFELDAVFASTSTQEQVYERSGAREAVCDSIFSGFNCTILAYGQTGTGKTFTMGSAAATTDSNGNAAAAATESDIDEHAGMIPRCCRDLFEQIQLKCDGNAEVELSYLEIYNENLRDLLSSDPHSNDDNHLKIRERMNGEMYVSGLTSRKVSSPQEIGALMEEASSRRTVASTAMNAVSSRSHAMCVLRVRGLLENSDDGTTDQFASKLTLVDLAGSERIKKTGAQGSRQREGININKSLLVLGQVVAALAEQRHKKHARKPPYRDSKLTRLLQDSLGGNSRTIMVACVSPADCNVEESINTLRYATAARNIKNTATRNIEKNISPEEAAKLQRENQLLKKQVQDLQRSLQMLSEERTSITSRSISFDDDSLMEEDKKMDDATTASISAASSSMTENLDNTTTAADDNGATAGAPKNQVHELEKEVKRLKRELHDVRASAGSSAVEQTALQLECEKLRDELQELIALKTENCELHMELDEARADAAASKKAAVKLSNVMDKLQELKRDEVEKKRLEYEHIQKEEKWVKFLSEMLDTRRDEMGKLGDDFDLVVRVVESPVSMVVTPSPPSRTNSGEEPSSTPASSTSTTSTNFSRAERRPKWLQRVAEDVINLPQVTAAMAAKAAGQQPKITIPEHDEELRHQLLTQHVAFFKSQMDEIINCINVEADSLLKIRKSLRRDREKLEVDIGLNEFVKDSLNSADEELLKQLTTVLIGPVKEV